MIFGTDLVYKITVKKKQVGLYETENINNANVLTIAIKPEAYFEKCKDFSVNKKHKGVKKIPLEWILKHI